MSLCWLRRPIPVGPLQLKNRIAMPPMVRLAPHVPAELLDTDGHVTDSICEHYARRARAGTALIIVEATCVHPSGRVWKHGLNAYDDSYIEGLTKLATAIADAGAVPGIQLVHGGPQADPQLCGGVTYGPSEVAPAVGEPEPRALTAAEILSIEESFLQAAARVADAGFVFIEIHAAHGYLLDSFISPIRNHRDDAFGGSLVNRMRIVSDILLRMKAMLDSRAAVGARISVFNHLADGFGADELRTMVQVLEHACADFVDLSCDRVLRPAFGGPQSMGQIARETTRLPVIVAGGITTPEMAEQVLAEGHGDIVGVGRAMLQNPDWSAQALCPTEAELH